MVVFDCANYKYHHLHQSVLPKGSYFTANSGFKAAVLPKGRSSTSNSGTKVAVSLRMNKCDTIPLLSVPPLFRIWTDLKRFENIPEAPVWRWGEWIWQTGPSGLHRNSRKGLNISSIWVLDQIRDPEIQITFRPLINIIVTAYFAWALRSRFEQL